ncbi:MAG: RNA polymerase subunit sigma, partial [Caldilinea sp.]|nr:RNA polymerase subunit sigma [Caldilinea sp.]MDW8441658.1 RNA polymerase sigma factor region1.1 domain-containing protein [Caldilineaceae bacterium]
MAKQKSMRASIEDDFSMDLEEEMNGEFIEETLMEGGETLEENADGEQEAPVALSPEAALESLLALGRAQGYVTYDDVLRVMPEAENSMEQLEDIFAALFEQGIDVGQPREEEPDMLADLGEAEMEETEIEEDDLDLSQIEIDDSISLYL